MRNETNATGATDSRSVVFPKQEHVKSLPVVLTAFENGRRVVSEGSIAKSYYPDPAEVKDGSPVARVEETASEAAWRIIGEWNLDKGYVTTESLERLSKVLHPEVQR